MASSSSPPDLSTKHDVFLSFRGTDTRHNFISHLAKDLRNKKIQTFTDDVKLKRGDEISPALMRAIQQSKISIIIFSVNYADSKWCLEELLKILECRNALNQIVIPVFYNVDPTHVRNQTGNFGIAFDRLLKDIDPSLYPNLIWRILLPSLLLIWNIAASESGKEQIWKILLSFLFLIWNITAFKAPKEQIWRKALKEAANLSGHSYNIGSEANLVDTILRDVLEKLKNNSNNACDHTGLVGINSCVEKIMPLLDIESPEIVMVGIWGMGGIGKTTIAEALFNKLSSEFEASYFLENVRERAGKNNGLRTMRDKLISKLLKEEKLEIDTPHIGNESTKERLRRTKVLAVLDDVDDSSHLEKLIGERGTNQFGPGSRIIVTTRDKHVLAAHNITCVYNMQMLDDNDALQLFSFYAFSQNQPMELYAKISEKIVEYANGVPLALRVLGSSLCGKIDIQHWEGILKKLKKVPPHKQILDVLKISYDSLEDEEKEIFLDISCLFKGKNVDMVRNVLDGCYVSSDSAMEALIDKSLIYISTRDTFSHHDYISVNVVEMHDLVQEMGWNIGSRSRLWRHEDARDVLTRNTGTNKIKAIIYNFVSLNVKQMNLDPQAFAKMHNLKFLKISSFDIQFPSGLESLPEGLRYLEWYNYRLEYLPPTFNPTNLVELHLPSSSLRRLWRGNQDLSSLKVLNLDGCDHLIELPDLSSAVNLEKLCLNSTNYFKSFSSSIKHLSSLKYLDLGWCRSLRETSSLGQLTTLNHLNLMQCHNLTNISSIGYLKNLTHLNLYSCKGLNEIPSSFQHLHSLTHFFMAGCTKITKFPNLPQNIKLLQIDAILVELISLLTPNPFGRLTNLVQLDLWNCTSAQQSSSFLEKIKGLVPQGCIISI